MNRSACFVKSRVQLLKSWQTRLSSSLQWRWPLLHHSFFSSVFSTVRQPWPTHNLNALAIWLDGFWSTSLDLPSSPFCASWEFPYSVVSPISSTSPTHLSSRLCRSYFSMSGSSTATGSSLRLSTLARSVTPYTWIPLFLLNKRSTLRSFKPSWALLCSFIGSCSSRSCRSSCSLWCSGHFGIESWMQQSVW